MYHIYMGKKPDINSFYSCGAMNKWGCYIVLIDKF